MGRPPNNSKSMSSGLDHKKIMIIFKGIMIISAIVMILFVVVRFAKNTMSEQSDYVTAGDSGLVLSVPSDSVIDFQPMGTGAVLLTNSELLFLNSSGGLARDAVSHSLVNPAMDVDGSRVILYDRSGNSYSIEKTSGTIFSGKTEKPIMTAAVAKKGGYAIATLTENAQGLLTYYSSGTSDKFLWECASDHIVDIDISPNRKKIAVAVIGSENAHIYSKVYIFDFDYETPYASFDYDNESVFSVEYTNNNTVLVYGSKIRSIIEKQERRDEALDIKSPRHLSYSENQKSAFLSARFSNNGTNTLDTYNKKGDLLFTKQLDETVKWISCSNSNVSVLFNNRCETYNYKGETIGTVNLGNDCIRVITASNNIFILSASGISRYKADDFLSDDGIAEITAGGSLPGDVEATALPPTSNETGLTMDN